MELSKSELVILVDLAKSLESEKPSRWSSHRTEAALEALRKLLEQACPDMLKAIGMESEE